VLFSGSRATPGDFDEYDPLLNGHSVTEPVAAAAAATTAAQAYAAPVDAVMPSAPVPPPESVIQQPQVDWQTAPGVHTPEPVIAPEPESYIPVQQEQWQQPYQPPQPEYEPQQYEQPVAQPYQEYVPEPVEPVQPYVEPQPEPEIVEEVKPLVHQCTILKKLKSAARVNASSWPPGISLCLNRCRSRLRRRLLFPFRRSTRRLLLHP
jgi:S-DNA-T family DNA segregation ATPase FtsK/SpoIIIE